ncbi:hypothetical protein [Alicyclobacillus dauci]|uniref:Uncharacterized protein n=1 Tax=Alicyclobacillus dauci TaxID=1475485 RepID=A0ABY6Z296_9BACL|nr:hypothetical protein [Alicyclobacillus dauci]WAH36962.1 hypothetical protein NZD86_22850 [Alicyclobacillus dauci]
MTDLQDRPNRTSNSLMSPVDDEVSSRLFTSVVAIVEDRRQLSAALQEYKQQVEDDQQLIEALKEERKHAQVMLEKKEDEIEAGRRLAAEKQLKYDQLLDDYNQLRANDAREYELLQQQIKESRLNYAKLEADYTRFRAESTKNVQKLESDIRNGVVQYQQLVEKYNKLRDENARLVAHIAKFTEQMSSFRLHDVSTQPQFDPVPIHPTVEPGEPSDK